MDVNMVAMGLWLILIVVFLVIDMSTSSIFLIGFIPAALLAFLLGLAGMDVIVQMVAMLIGSALTVLLLYPKLKRASKKVAPLQKTYEENFVGQVHTLTEDCDESCQQMYNGIYWTFVNDTDQVLSKGTKVKITAIKGNKIVIQENK